MWVPVFELSTFVIKVQLYYTKEYINMYSGMRSYKKQQCWNWSIFYIQKNCISHWKRCKVVIWVLSIFNIYVTILLSVLIYMEEGTTKKRLKSFIKYRKYIKKKTNMQYMQTERLWKIRCPRITVDIVCSCHLIKYSKNYSIN